MMRKFLILLVFALAFIACDYAKEASELKPDIEITYINPLGWYTVLGDTILYATIEEIHFVPENSVDCYLKELVWEYYDVNDNCFFGPTDPLALYGKIEGIVDPCCVDTFILLGVSLPLDTIRTYLQTKNLQSAKALLHFIAVDEYSGDKYDTCTVWFGIYMMP